MSTSEAVAIGQVVDTARYPLADPASGDWRSVVARTRRELREAGCSVLPDFIRPALADVLRRECAALADLAHDDVETVNAYNIDVTAPLPEGHPGRITAERGNAFVARDQIPADLLIHRLYTSEPFRHFVASCFGLPRVHELADPLAGLCLNVVNPGMEHPWHFDTNEFTVSMLTQEPQAGGVFEYCPNIRSAHAENLADVRDVLTGRGGRTVRRLTLRPGDLQLFKGRYSLHRVSSVQGRTARHSAIFAYSERPGVIGSVARTEQLFGRVLPEHLAAAKSAVRVDQLLD
ncbi:HalD/BesD family halogenase [Actinomadura xylanilytica]|uniref:HalD/BesD family halogenase n=1 Tax=Actinomadura xylanilytica TaxID=887459 RepID=UPI00255B0A27|nr:arpA protein [Actinomadura xylanilytica]MDL4775433.1 arpA protein [Actinomadura xylanilytica]